MKGRSIQKEIGTMRSHMDGAVQSVRDVAVSSLRDWLEDNLSVENIEKPKDKKRFIGQLVDVFDTALTGMHDVGVEHGRVSQRLKEVEEFREAASNKKRHHNRHRH